MAVSQENPLYSQFKTKWQRCRDTIGGSDDVKTRGETYLPRIGDMSDLQYEAFKQRARYLNAMSRTVDGLTGLVMRKEPVITGEFELFQTDISGTTIEEYMLATLADVLSTGRGGTLVDFPVAPENMSVADAENLGLQPSWNYYPAEDILNWKKNDSGIYTMLVLRESYTENDLDDEFSTEVNTRYRVLDINEGFYRVRVIDEDGVIIGAEMFPKMNGTNMTAIPFVQHGRGFKPPLLDVADLNLSWYTLSADFRHGMHFVALPTPYVTGISADDAPSEIGPQKLWVLENEAASVGLLEFAGLGLSTLSDEMGKIENNMAQLGARMLSDMANGPDETATAANIRSSAETSALATLVLHLNEDFKRITDITLEWAGKPATETEDDIVQYNTDLAPMKIDPTMISALVGAYQQGAITLETLIENLQQGEIISGDVTADEYAEALEMELPPTMANQLDMEEEREERMPSDDSGDAE